MSEATDTAEPIETTDEPVIRVADEARKMVLDIRSAETDPQSLALFIEVNGSANGAYSYDIWFEALADAAPDDAVVRRDGLEVVIPAGSVDKVRGALLDVDSDGTGLVMVNPNTPQPAHASPSMGGEPKVDLSDPLAQQVAAVLDQVVNPSIASHGGYAELVAMEGSVAYLRMLGGCQGCGMAKVTLTQGITNAILDAVPEVTDVIDVTDHAMGTNPYYEPAY
jgi:Fe/S biogenesis protein NfuA